MDTRLIEKRHYTKDESSAAVLGALELALREMGFEVSVNDDHLVGKRGSILFVGFFGAFFVRRERLPVLVDAQIAGNIAGTTR